VRAVGLPTLATNLWVTAFAQRAKVAKNKSKLVQHMQQGGIIMKKFTEITHEQTRELNDGVKTATLMSIAGACGSVVRSVTPAPAPSAQQCLWLKNGKMVCTKDAGAGFHCTGHSIIVAFQRMNDALFWNKW
jgi:hypothetical protein